MYARIIIYILVVAIQAFSYSKLIILSTNTEDEFVSAVFKKTKLNSIFDVKKIVTLHYFEFDRSFEFCGEAHDFWEMVYVDKGSVAVMAGDVERVLSQGEILFHAPNEFHSIRAFNTSPNIFVISFVISSDAMNEFVGFRTVLDKPLKPFISSIITEAERAFVIPKNDTEARGLVHKQNAPLGAEQLIKTYLEQLLILLLRGKHKHREASVFPSKANSESQLVRATKKYINANANKKIRISDICRALGYSKSYLSKIFKEQSGETIVEHITTIKISRAKSLIRESNYTLAEISDKLAFDNPQYFSRVFKRKEGMSPSEFKQTLKR